MPLPALIEVQGMVRVVAGQRLLNQVDFTIRPGDRLAILGPTGSGKSLLLRAIALLDAADAGVVKWMGHQIPHCGVPAYRSRVVYLHQRPAFTEGSVAENIRAPFRFRTHRGRHWNDDELLQALAVFGRYASFLRQPARDLSGGESQLVALLRVLHLEPNVLLLDEPTSALDDETRSLLEEMVQGWWHAGRDRRAVVWVTHDPQQSTQVADRRFRMLKGTLKEIV